MLSLDLELHYRPLDHLSKNTGALCDLHKMIDRVIIDSNHLIVEICPENLAKHVNEGMALDIQLADSHRGPTR